MRRVWHCNCKGWICLFEMYQLWQCGEKSMYDLSIRGFKKAYDLPCYQAIENACETFFGCELWFLTYFKSHPVWAVNRDHLNYLIRYLSADLREKPVGYPFKKQADHLPSFMKSAKNRERIVRLLTKMQMEF